MSKTVAKLLEKPEAAVSKKISKLEMLAGFPGEDARLLAENSRNLRTKLTQLGLDPNDTTSQELYQVLKVKYQKDCANINKALGIGQHSSFYARSNLAIEFIGQTVKNQEVWGLKTSVAKTLLKNQAPKRLMKQLHYRSVDSLIKRQSMAEVFLALPFFESKSWLHDFQAKLRRQSPANYELKKLQIVKLNAEKWGSWQSAEITSSSRTIGAIGLLPTQAAQLAPALTLSLVLAAEVEKLAGIQATKALTQKQPLLAWWTNTEHLLSLHQDQTVSLNANDACLNHLYSLDYNARINNHAQQSFWQELTNRYKKYQQELSSFSYNVSDEFSTSLMPARELALEYIEA